MNERRASRRRTAPAARSTAGRAAGVVVAILALLAGIGAVLVMAGALDLAPLFGTPPAPRATDMRGNPAELDPGESLSQAEQRQQNATTGGLGRLAVPSVGLNVPLGQMNAVAGVLTPPGFTSAYQVRNIGVPLSAAETGTVYVVMHSMRDGSVGPGNYLFDVKTGASKVAVGAEVIAGTHSYRVAETSVVLKSALSTDQTVWAPSPDRLVIVTCLQKPQGGPSSDNFIVTATLTR